MKASAGPVTRRIRRVIIIAGTLTGVSDGGSILVVLAASFDGAFVVGIPSDSSSGFCAEALAVVLVTAGAGGGGFFEEEVEEFVGDGEVGLLLKLLEGH